MPSWRVAFFMAHVGASRKSPKDAPWETLRLRLNRPISIPVLSWRYKEDWPETHSPRHSLFRLHSSCPVQTRDLHTISVAQSLSDQHRTPHSLPGPGWNKGWKTWLLIAPAIQSYVTSWPFIGCFFWEDRGWIWDKVINVSVTSFIENLFQWKNGMIKLVLWKLISPQTSRQTLG